jgi:hypothetical protein
MSCPHLKEVVMLFCDAYPVKKMLPLDRIATAHPCLGHDFEQCPLYQELLARFGDSASPCATSGCAVAASREDVDAARARAHTRHAGHGRLARH